MSSEELDAAVLPLQRDPTVGTDPRFIPTPNLNPFLSLAGMSTAAGLSGEVISSFVPSDYSRMAAGGPSAAEQQRYDHDERS